ncbi:MAG: S8 family peptidase [Nanoarchaeota archaeon]
MIRGKNLLLLALLSLIFVMCASAVFSDPEKDVDQPRRIVVVREEPAAPPLRMAAGIQSVHTAAAQKTPKRLRFEVIEVDDPAQVEQVLEELSQDPSIISAEKDIVRYLQAEPDDPFLTNQYGLDISWVRDAWDVVQGNSDVTIAIIDTGMDMDHPDLVGNLWNNTDEIADNGIDDDGNGYVDDVHGWDFYAGDNYSDDLDGHGTHVAGIAAATWNNSAGIAGVCPGCSLMPLRAGDQGFINLSMAILAIDYAVQNGADVISMSYGAAEEYEPERLALQQAYDNNVALVAAAGNDGTDDLLYPASYNMVISVASVDNESTRSWFSSYGDAVAVAAAGSQIYSTYPSATYAYSSGTSMAAPFVAGALGLYLSLFEENYVNVSQIASWMTSTGADIGDQQIGPLINVSSLVRMDSCEGVRMNDYLLVDGQTRCISACAALNRSNSQYLLSQNLSVSTSCFTVTGQNISIDCDGHALVMNGSDADLFFLDQAQNVTVRDCRLSLLQNGTLIRARDSANVTVTNTTFSLLGGTAYIGDNLTAARIDASRFLAQEGDGVMMNLSASEAVTVSGPLFNGTSSYVGRYVRVFSSDTVNLSGATFIGNASGRNVTFFEISGDCQNVQLMDSTMTSLGGNITGVEASRTETSVGVLVLENLSMSALVPDIDIHGHQMTVRDTDLAETAINGTRIHLNATGIGDAGSLQNITYSGTWDMAFQIGHNMFSTSLPDLFNITLYGVDGHQMDSPSLFRDGSECSGCVIYGGLNRTDVQFLTLGNGNYSVQSLRFNYSGINATTYQTDSFVVSVESNVNATATYTLDDDEPVPLNASADNRSFNATLVGVSEGWHTLYLNVSGEHVQKSVAIRFAVDTQVPRVDAISPDQTSYALQKLNISLDLNMSEPLSSLNLTQIHLATNATVNEVIPLLPGNTSAQVRIPLIAYGLTNLSFRFVDTLGSAGEYSMAIEANATYTGSSVNDADGDGVNNSEDRLIGDIQNVFSDYTSLNISVDGNDTLDVAHQGSQDVSIADGGHVKVRFLHNFSAQNLTLSGVVLRNRSVENNSAMIVYGIDASNKTIYLELLGDRQRYGGVCIHDAEIFSLQSISANCSGSAETYISSFPFSSERYVANYTNSSNTTVFIQGVTHSGVAQQCAEQWVCVQTESCGSSSVCTQYNDSNACGTYHEQPAAGSCPVIRDTSSSGGSSSSSSGGSSGIAYVPLAITSSVPKQIAFRRYYNVSYRAQHALLSFYKDNDAVVVRLIEQNDTRLTFTGPALDVPSLSWTLIINKVSSHDAFLSVRPYISATPQVESEAPSMQPTQQIMQREINSTVDDQSEQVEGNRVMWLYVSAAVVLSVVIILLLVSGWYLYTRHFSDEHF